MASVDGRSGIVINQDSNGVSQNSDKSPHGLQLPQSTQSSSEIIERSQPGQQTADSVPAKSLFGPFPESAATSDDGQHGVTSAESGNMSAPASATTTEPVQDSRDIGPTGTDSSSSPLNCDTQTREPSRNDGANQSLIAEPLPPPLMREKTAPAIGPATDKPTPVPKESEIEGPVLFITLLLSSTGARHPYKLDEKYLRKRNVIVEGSNPINISLYKLKELILRDWREGKKASQMIATFLFADTLGSRMGGQAIQP